MKFPEELDKYTAPPKDGDYDAHIHKAMKAVWDYQQQKIDKLIKVTGLVNRDYPISDVCYKCQDQKSIDYYKGQFSMSCVKCFTLKRDEILNEN